MDKLKLLIPVLFLLIFTPLYAQTQTNSADPAKEFEHAVNLYNTSNFAPAQKIFAKIASEDKFNPKTTISFLFDGKSLLALKQYKQCEDVLKEFLNNYRESSYCDEARATLAKAYYESGNKYAAFKELTSLAKNTGSPVYSSYAKTTAQKIAENYLTIDQVAGLSDSITAGKIKPFFMLIIGKMYMDKAYYNKAESIFAGLLKKYPGSEEKSEAATLYQHIANDENLSPETPIIGVMLPLTGVSSNASNAASEILEGIKYAVDKYNKDHDIKVGLIIRDTQRNNEKIEEIHNEFINIPNLRVILGPLFSDEVKQVLKDFNDSGIPILSPTATENNLTDLDPDFFQANPSFDIRGKVMADYIYYVENKRKISVLNAAQGYSPLLATAFVNEFTNIGGQILNHQVYNSSETEYTVQDSLIAADSLILEGVYLPLASKRDVPALLSNFAQVNLDVAIYGNQDWFPAKGYETYPSMSNKLTFTSDYYIDYTDTTLENFSRNFFAQTNVDVDRNVLYGYDLTNYVLSVLPYAPDRKSLKNGLESATIFRGLHNNFYFDQSRVNKFLNIVRYRDGKFQLVDKFKTGN